jgi:hypothetical protein
MRYGLRCVFRELPICQSRLTMPRPIPPEGRWTERHRLVSFYASDEVRAWIDEEMRRTGASKTQVIVYALEEQRRAGGSSSGRRRRSAR